MAPPAPLVHPHPQLTDGTVELRGWSTADVRDIVHISRDREMIRYTSVPVPYREADAYDWLSRQARELADGTGIAWAVTEAGDGRALGSVGLSVDPVNLSAELGYGMGPEGRGRGLMTRAVELVSTWALAELGLARLQLRTHVDNVGSQRVAQKAGFRREALMRSVLRQRGTRVDLVMWSRLASDPGPAGSATPGP